MLSDLPELFQTLSWLQILFFSNAVQLSFWMFKNCSAPFVFRLFKCCPTCQSCSKLSLGFWLFSFLMLFSSPLESSTIVQPSFVFRLFKCFPTCRNCSTVPRKRRVVAFKNCSSPLCLDCSNAFRPAGTVQRLPGNGELSRRRPTGRIQNGKRIKINKKIRKTFMK